MWDIYDDEGKEEEASEEEGEKRRRDKMSTSMLFSRQLWKLKCYQLGTWGTLRTRISALCTTNSGEVSKTAEKPNDPDERATLLKYKTSVSFPMRVSNHGSLGIAAAMSNTHAGKVVDTLPIIANTEIEQTKQNPPLGQTPHSGTTLTVTDTRSTTAEESFISATAPGNTATTETPDCESGDQKSPEHLSALVSDSSDSDSDSDSDSETDSLTTSASVQEVPQFPQNTQVQVKEKEDEANKELIPEHEANSASATLPEEAAHEKASENIMEVKNVGAVADQMESSPQFQDLSEELSEIKQTELQAHANSVSELSESGTSPTVPGGSENTAFEAVSKVSNPEQDSTDAILETTVPVCAEVSADTAPLLAEDESVVQGTDEAVCAEVSANTETLLVEDESVIQGTNEAVCAEVGANAEPLLVEAESVVQGTDEAAALPVDDAVPSGATTDVAPMVLTSSQSTSELPDPLREELQTDTSLEENAAQAPAEPEEIIDNSTYRNYQHHSYTPYTFADMDVEMAKYRLPQPSSGRSSPRH
ncbi:serine-rich adhesin for platelets isoform X2 [Corythoichthys intestinalis]|uniref:serine-rich adhesin for platelets isoform X2 n=1 Tax=Corythoichthys intestinalis TaxID=161448 RepID=UPI0025A5DE81|nr:serine-rich adhesin for platelets isoform X2 [Corythoichthys intestinalis]